MINHIRIKNFRSVRDIELELGALNIVFGPNGCGKSNIYKAIHLLTACADGKFSGYISDEGGLENIMWSGPGAPTDRFPRRLQIGCVTDEFDYQLQVGFPEKLPYPTQFQLDPIVKEESIWLAGFSRRPSSRVLERKNQAAFLVDVNGEKSTFTDAIYENESIFGQLGEPHRFPEVSRQTLTAATPDSRLSLAGARQRWTQPRRRLSDDRGNRRGRAAARNPRRSLSSVYLLL